MTAFDIYSAIGNVSEDILEESETVLKKKTAKIIPLMAAAACFAVFAFGISHALRNDGIEQSVTETAFPESESLLTGIVWSETITNDVTESEQILTDIEILYTAPNVTTETAEMFTEPYPSVTEETTVGPTDTTVSVTITATMTTEPIRDEEETAIVPKWEDMSDLERYSYLDYNGVTYSMTMEKFNKSELTFLQNGELYGFEGDYYDDDVDSAKNRRSMPCAFYKIKNVNENYKIVVFTADGNYTAFRNFHYRPDSLGSYVKDIDFSNRYKLTTIKSETHDLVDGEVITRYFEYDLPDLQQAVEKLIEENSDAVPEINPPSVTGRYHI
ncbi:MAG: hypothetical protein K2G87_09880, partial [Oscillospiraceae bacterium]|nr:hypothetical protein [Oscillospiraceae bacterium]